MLLSLLVGAVPLLVPHGTRAGQDDGRIDGRTEDQAGLDALRDGRVAEAIAAWKRSAERGDATAALFLGVMADTGQGEPQDHAQALSWYRRAADEGSASGAFNVGILYDLGQGVTRDHAEAARWYARAADAGFGRAEYDLGLMYETGDGVPRDTRRAAQLFRSAQRHGLTAAAGHLARLGQPTTRFVVRQVSAQERVETLNLDEFRRAQMQMLDRTPEQAGAAVSSFRRVAERRDAIAQYAQYDLGYCYENGVGVGADKRQAYSWYLRSSLNGGDSAVSSIAASAARNLEAQLTPAQLEQARGQVAPGR